MSAGVNAEGWGQAGFGGVSIVGDYTKFVYIELCEIGAECIDKIIVCIYNNSK